MRLVSYELLAWCRHPLRNGKLDLAWWDAVLLFFGGVVTMIANSVIFSHPSGTPHVVFVFDKGFEQGAITAFIELGNHVVDVLYTSYASTGHESVQRSA